MTREDISLSIGNISPRHIQEAENYFINQRFRIRFRKIGMIAAVLCCFLILSAFALSIFSSLAGDRLVMNAQYAGDGIVWLEITNQSDKDLKLQPALKLFYYSSKELVSSTGEEPYIDDLTIPANSTKKIRLDLRRTYDIESLENSKNDFYYLQITNNRFLLGQKWSCMVSFVVSDYVTPYYPLTDDRHLSTVLPSLQSSFYNFTPDIFARWPDAFDYMERVEAELCQVNGNIVRPSDDYTLCWDSYDWMVSQFSSSFDAYNKLMGRDDTEDFVPISVSVPCLNDEGEFNGGWYIPVFFPYKFAVADIQSPQDYAFIRGNLLTFEQMEPYKVYEDEQFVIYEMHEFFYSDLRTYVEDMLLQRDDMYFNDEIWKRIEDFYNYFNGNPEFGQRFQYLPIQQRLPLSIDNVMELSKLGADLTVEDFKPYFAGHSEAGYRYGVGMHCNIDDDYEMFYSKNISGTPIGFYLIHTPTGDRIQIGTSDTDETDVAAFVDAHSKPEPRCQCSYTDAEAYHHGWQLTLDWLIENGKDIDNDDLDRACRTLPNKQDYYNYRYIIDDSFFVYHCWDEELREWGYVLVHRPSYDECWLETEDIQAFVEAHQ